MFSTIRKKYTLPDSKLLPKNVSAAESGQADVIRDSLRKTEKNIHLFGSQILSQLSDVMNIGQSVFYLRERNKGKDCLVARAGFASYRPDASNLIFKMGEGLVGQVAYNGEALHLEKVPGEYITIASGLGQGTPRSLYIHPLKQEEEVYGVLELASFSPLDESAIKLLADLEEYLGSICKKYSGTGEK